MNTRIWDRHELLTFQDGKTYTPDEIAAKPEFGFTSVIPAVIDEIAPGVVGSFSPIYNIRDSLGLPHDTPLDEILSAYIDFLNASPVQTSSDNAPLTRADMQYLLQQNTETELMILEAIDSVRKINGAV